MNPIDTLKAHATSRIAQLKKEIEILEQFVRSAEAVTPLLTTWIHHPSDQSLYPILSRTRPSLVGDPADHTGDIEPPKSRKPRIGNPPSNEVIDLAIEVLRDHKGPMSRRELHGAYRGLGWKSEGATQSKRWARFCGAHQTESNTPKDVAIGRRTTLYHQRLRGLTHTPQPTFSGRWMTTQLGHEIF